MINKELLNKVLNRKKCRDIELHTNTIHYCFNKTDCGFINIYELANKCKVWASQDYELHSAILDNKASCELFSTSLQEEEFYADTEPEAIFKACQWILENKDTK